MTNRDDFSISSAGNADYGLTKNRSHHSLNHQVKDEFVHLQDPKSRSKKISVGVKLSKPTLEIYRPPKINVKNGTKVHFQSPPRTKTSPTPQVNELKSALKRSKSFTNSDLTEVAAVGFDKETFPLEYHGLIRSAMLDPNMLSCRQLMELVKLICSKAVESIQNSEPAAQLCFNIIEKEKGTTFLDSLLNACREWYNERDVLLRSSFPGSQSFGGSRRWTAYVSFLTELYLRLKSQHHQSTRNNLMKAGSTSPLPDTLQQHHTFTLFSLLYECSQVILKPPAVNNVAEIECLRSMFITVGKQLEKDSPQKMQQVMVALRDAFVNPSVTTQIRKTILELVEIQASNWQLDLSQSLYYFPYTTMDRR